MITYVDTSALLKLVVEEAGSDAAGLIWDAADERVAVGLVVVEGRAALAAARRGRRLTVGQHRRARTELDDLIAMIHLIEVTGDLIGVAADIAESDALRGYDAVHLAGAVLVEAAVVTSADAALCDAASARGFHVANPVES